MTIDEIKKHNEQYYDEESMNIWKSRELLFIDGVYVPQYVYKGNVDPLDHRTDIYKHIIKNREIYEGKKFLDIGCCAGINNLLLTKDGFEVVGLDNSIYSLNASLYAMTLNNLYYKVILGDHNDIESMDYDILLVNQMDYLPGFMDALSPILRRQKEKGKEVIMMINRQDRL